MKSFNLLQFYKKAMGTMRQENRPVYSWFDVTDTSVESNPQWQNLVQAVPSLMSILREARSMHQSKGRDIRNQYGLSQQQVQKCLKTYVGYDVNFGGYILLVGPYLGQYFANSIDKFAFYVLRKGYVSENELLTALDKKMKNYTDAFGITLTPEDFNFVAKQRSLDQDDSLQRSRNVEPVEFNMGGDDPRYNRFFSQNRMLGSGSLFQLSNSGVVKLIKNNWGPLFDRAIDEISVTRGLTPEQAESVLVQDTDFVERVYDTIRNKYKEAVASGEASIAGMTEPPVLSKLKMAGKAGAQRTTTIIDKQKPLLKKLQLNDQILSIMMTGERDPQTIMNQINAQRKVNKQVPITVIQAIMQDYLDRASDDNMSLDQVYAEFRENITNLEQQSGGLTDLRTAFDAVKAHLGHEVFTVDDNFPNVTEEDLREIRLAYEEAKRNGEHWNPDTPQIEETSEEEDVERELEMEVGRVPVEEPLEIIPEDVEEEELAEKTDQEDLSYMDVFSGTLKTLVKIAKELDNEGKKDGSEEIKKIIRKYHKEKE